MADDPKSDEVLQESMIYQPGGKGGVLYDRGTKAADMNEQAVEQARSQGLFDADTVPVIERAPPHLPVMSGLSPDDASRPVGAPRTVVGPAETVKVMRAVKDSKTGEEEEVEEVVEEGPSTPPQMDSLSPDDASHPVPPPDPETIPPAPASPLSPDDASHPAEPPPVEEEMTAEEKTLQQQLNPSDPSTGVRKGAKVDVDEEGKPVEAEPAEAEPVPVTEISGVGPAMATKLKAEGITDASQIAALSEAEASALDDKLQLGGRILRDDWIGQAKKLVG